MPCSQPTWVPVSLEVLAQEIGQQLAWRAAPLARLAVHRQTDEDGAHSSRPLDRALEGARGQHAREMATIPAEAWTSASGSTSSAARRRRGLRPPPRRDHRARESPRRRAGAPAPGRRRRRPDGRSCTGLHRGRPSRRCPRWQSRRGAARTPRRRSPAPPGMAGSRTSTSSSSGASRVVRYVSKSSPAFSVRRPRGLRTTTSPSSAVSTAGYSAEGSAWAIEPPMVPRERMGRCPTHRVASSSSGRRRATTGENSIVRCRVMAPKRALAVVLAHVGELGDAIDVDERGRPREPEVQHRHQALATSQHLGVAAVAGESHAPRRGCAARGTRTWAVSL